MYWKPELGLNERVLEVNKWICEKINSGMDNHEKYVFFSSSIIIAKESIFLRVSGGIFGRSTSGQD